MYLPLYILQEDLNVNTFVGIRIIYQYLFVRTFVRMCVHCAYVKEPFKEKKYLRAPLGKSMVLGYYNDLLDSPFFAPRPFVFPGFWFRFISIISGASISSVQAVCLPCLPGVAAGLHLLTTVNLCKAGVDV